MCVGAGSFLPLSRHGSYLHVRACGPLRPTTICLHGHHAWYTVICQDTRRARDCSLSDKSWRVAASPMRLSADGSA